MNSTIKNLIGLFKIVMLILFIESSTLTHSYILANIIANQLETLTPLTEDLNLISDRIWKGNNPYFQPFNSTDYYGSGDVDLNGIVDNEDINQINLIIAGQLPQVIRADVNGDGKIDITDIELINTTFSGGILPGWWNMLSSREERISWLQKMLALDKVNEHPYITGSYECYNFATQLYHNFTGYNEFSSRYFSSQTKFNIPVYYVLIYPPSGISHIINAVLVGENPLDFNDWFFIEPQTDGIVYPRIGYTPVNSLIYLISLPNTNHLIFALNESDYWRLRSKNETFISKRPLELPNYINNKPFLWHPRTVSDDLIICERNRDDMERKYDICFIGTDIKLPLNDNYRYTDLPSVNNTIVAAQEGGNERIYLIWKGDVDLQRKTYFGCIDKKDYKLISYDEIDFLQNVISIKTILSPNKQVDFFWKVSNTSGKLNGIYWAAVDDELKLGEPLFIKLSDNPKIDITDFKVHYNAKGERVIHYSFLRNYRDIVFRMKFDDVGTRSETLDSTSNQWLIGFDKNEFTYLFTYSYWFGSDGLYYIKASDSLMLPKKYVGIIRKNSIQEINVIDDAFYLVGSDFHDVQIVPVWYTFKDDRMSSCNYLEVTEGCNASNISCLAKDGKLIVAWQEISDKLVTFNYDILNSELTNISTNSETITDFSLFQNFPNPFNSSTIIKYSVPENSIVLLKVYDILGREVATLINEEKLAGEYTVRFDVSSGLSSGIYFCKLITNSIEGKKVNGKCLKLMLIK